MRDIVTHRSVGCPVVAFCRERSVPLSWDPRSDRACSNPRSAQAAGPGIGLAVPIPTTTEFFPGVQSHVQAPPFLEGPDSDPATVYNFQGATGIAFISGMVDRWNRRTGERRRLPYLFNDMRFMQGVFRGRDGHARNATFGFV